MTRRELALLFALLVIGLVFDSFLVRAACLGVAYWLGYTRSPVPAARPRRVPPQQEHP